MYILYRLYNAVLYIVCYEIILTYNSISCKPVSHDLFIPPCTLYTFCSIFLKMIFRL
ncbi:hypothetical protein CLOHYLEM_04311 [[Clostridium] hylemonae DSM 15053]|uniref:Uncharacterized protein n=1 Tax=[Clostridium] hylemonae DSM 15053 TaxID=553973 RepID=C0BWX7_9FIRM|nr:hypothetical protein CLOHYLEM_04311 [[Clostridium] hylemonae DSM 15053]